MTSSMVFKLTHSVPVNCEDRLKPTFYHGNTYRSQTKFNLRWWLLGKWHASLAKFVHFFFFCLKPSLEIEKEIVCEAEARGDKPYLRKSADRKAQIRKAFVQLSELICALRSADFLREGLSPRATSRTISFSINFIIIFFFVIW